MDIVTVEAKTIYGIATRTCNKNEFNPATARIGKTWARFDKEIAVDYQGGERVYGVYYNYESDANGEFDVMAGTEKTRPSLQQVTIPAGRYLLFRATASTADDQSRIQAVIDTWGTIWKYFASDTAEYQRAYQTDFEYYKNPLEIEIYISIT